MISRVKETTTPFLWIDVVDPTAEELNGLAAEFKLHPAAVKDCLQPEHLPKYELIDDTHFIITRYFDVNCSKHSDNIQELSRKLSIFFSTGFIITIHRQPFSQYDQVKERYDNHPHLFDLLCKIIRSTLITYEDPVSKLDTDTGYYESRIFLKKKTPDLLKSLYTIKRRIYVIRKIVNLSQDAIDKVGQNHKRTPAYQDLKDAYVKLDTQIEEVHDSIQSLLNLYITLSSQRTNEVMRTLTVFTAFFLPLTFIVGIYGMNFRYMPELEDPMGYPAVMGVMLLITIGIYTWFKRKGWL